MTYDVVFAHFAACLAFFLILNWLGAHSVSYGYKQLSLLYTQDEAPLFNLTFRLAAPLVYIILLSAALYSFGLDRYVEKIYLVTLYSVAFRIMFNLGMGHARLLNWTREIFLAITSTSVSYYAYKNLIVSKTFLFPNYTTVANELWIVIAIFLYSVGNKIQIGSVRSRERKTSYLRKRFVDFQQRYDRLISGVTKDPHLQALIYSVIIYENFNRPALLRAIERVVLIFSGPRTIGVMQVRTGRNISDEESVLLGAKKIVADWNDGIQKNLSAAMARYSKEKNLERRRKYGKADIFRKVIAQFNGGTAYGSEISYLYSDILKQFYPKVRDNILEPWRDA